MDLYYDILRSSLRADIRLSSSQIRYLFPFGDTLFFLSKRIVCKNLRAEMSTGGETFFRLYFCVLKTCKIKVSFR